VAGELLDTSTTYLAGLLWMILAKVSGPGWFANVALGLGIVHFLMFIIDALWERFYRVR